MIERVEFWRKDRLVVHGGGECRVLSWPGLEVVAEGEGTIIGHPDTDLWLIRHRDELRVSSGEAVTVPEELATLTTVGWDVDAILVAGRSRRFVEASVDESEEQPTAESFISPQRREFELWRIPLGGSPPVLLASLMTPPRLVCRFRDGIVFTHRDVDPQADTGARLLWIARSGGLLGAT